MLSNDPFRYELPSIICAEPGWKFHDAVRPVTRPLPIVKPVLVQVMPFGVPLSVRKYCEAACAPTLAYGPTTAAR